MRAVAVEAIEVGVAAAVATTTVELTGAAGVTMTVELTGEVPLGPLLLRRGAVAGEAVQALLIVLEEAALLSPLHPRPWRARARSSSRTTTEAATLLPLAHPHLQPLPLPLRLSSPARRRMQTLTVQVA